ncbi:Hemoglobin-haptoglobin-binding protein A, partial [Bienertia sinuspersici]
SLIGLDGTHLKGNYVGILLFTIALDANNEIFPIAYSIISIENEENWFEFFWHLYNMVEEDGETDWAIISDRQKNLSRNFEKDFQGPLIYILFWRDSKATNPFTFIKRLRKVGKSPIICDTNTSNFIESFNSTLGFDRCRPILTLL